MDVKEKILQYIKINGPNVPTKIAKDIEQSSLFVSAYLSEMKEKGMIKISSIKIGGGSPLYFLAGQEQRLQTFSENLSEKEKKVFDLLKANKVLRDSKLVPVFRAAIRTIKDFAFPFNVNLNGITEIFWRWQGTTTEEARQLVRKILGIPEKRESIVPEKKFKEENTDLSTEDKKEKAGKESKEITEFKEVKRFDESKDSQKTKEVEEIKEGIRAIPKKKILEVQEKIISSKEKGNTLLDQDSDFYEELIRYFDKNNIQIKDTEIIRKKTEIDFIVEIPSNVGPLMYYVKSKSKKRVNEGDLSTAFVNAQTKRLPALFISKGALNKKAEEMLVKEFKGMKFANI